LEWFAIKVTGKDVVLEQQDEDRGKDENCKANG